MEAAGGIESRTSVLEDVARYRVQQEVREHRRVLVRDELPRENHIRASPRLRTRNSPTTHAYFWFHEPRRWMLSNAAVRCIAVCCILVRCSLLSRMRCLLPAASCIAAFVVPCPLHAASCPLTARTQQPPTIPFLVQIVAGVSPVVFTPRHVLCHGCLLERPLELRLLARATTLQRNLLGRVRWVHTRVARAVNSNPIPRGMVGHCM